MTDLGKTSTLAIIIGILLGVGLLACCIGYFFYKRYREKREREDISKVQAEIEKIRKVD